MRSEPGYTLVLFMSYSEHMFNGHTSNSMVPPTDKIETDSRGTVLILDGAEGCYDLEISDERILNPSFIVCEQNATKWNLMTAVWRLMEENSSCYLLQVTLSFGASQPPCYTIQNQTNLTQGSSTETYICNSLCRSQPKVKERRKNKRISRIIRGDPRWMKSFFSPPFYPHNNHVGCADKPRGIAGEKVCVEQVAPWWGDGGPRGTPQPGRKQVGQVEPSAARRCVAARLGTLLGGIKTAADQEKETLEHVHSQPTAL
ncbi:uncharacterized protein LOC143823983 [Paroedura picta]|uniref:uncharacterized protein LOC143823983 n=1 Tax=Paroedura picta TaxID=143630 RepID=UPI004056631A